MLELALITARVNNAVRVLDQHEVARLSRRPLGCSRDPRVTRLLRLDAVLVPLLESLAYLYEHLSTLLDKGV